MSDFITRYAIRISSKFGGRAKLYPFICLNEDEAKIVIQKLPYDAKFNDFEIVKIIPNDMMGVPTVESIFGKYSLKS